MFYYLRSFWAGNFRTVDIESKSWSSLFLNLETSLILYLYPEKCIKLNQSEWRIRGREIWIFSRHLRLICRNGWDSLILKNQFLIFLFYIQKRMSKKLKVSTVDIWIKKSGLKVSHSKVPSSELRYKHKIRLVSRLKKREDQALIHRDIDRIDLDIHHSKVPSSGIYQLT